MPRIRFILVPQTGQVPLAIRRPLVSATFPSNRFSWHVTFTQYRLSLSAIVSSFRHNRADVKVSSEGIFTGRLQGAIPHRHRRRTVPDTAPQHGEVERSIPRCVPIPR